MCTFFLATVLILFFSFYHYKISEANEALPIFLIYFVRFSKHRIFAHAFIRKYYVDTLIVTIA